MGSASAFAPFGATGAPLGLAAAGAYDPRFSGGLFTGSIPITNTQLNALSVTPLTLVPAPPVGFVLIPVMWDVEVIKTIASGGPSASIRCRYQGIATDLLGTLVTDLANARKFATTGVQLAASLTSSTIAQISNKALMVDASAAGPFGGSDATLRVTVCCYMRPSSY